MAVPTTSTAKTLVLTPTKRPVGRPPGLGKVPGSGRKKGKRDNWREELDELFEVNAAPLAKFLLNVALGRRVSAPDPNDQTKIIRRVCPPDLRVAAAKTLVGKGWPDLKSVAHTGPAGEPLVVHINTSPPA